MLNLFNLSNFFNKEIKQQASLPEGVVLKYQEYSKIHVMYMDKLLMVDWDISGSNPVDHHYTVKNKEEIHRLLKFRVAVYPNELWKVYDTPSGGCHAFLLSHEYTPEEGIGILKFLKGDRLYQHFSLKKKVWSARISPKPGRDGDYIARFSGYIGNGKPLPRNLEIMAIHDSYLS
jgi:hypothetical protein